MPALPRGRVVFLDANIFVYGLLGESEQCLAFMERCRNEEVAGVTSTEVLGEACHRLMVKEAVDEGLINRPAAYALKPKYDAIRRLRRYWDLTARVFDLNLVIFSSGEARHRAAQKSQAATWTPDERLPYRSGMPGAGDSIAGDLGCRF